MRTLLLWFSSLTLVVTAAGQDLRRGLTGADVVLVGRQIGKKPHGEQVVLHRVQVVSDVRGAAGLQTLTVLDWPDLSLHVRPTPRQQRLFCLEDASRVAARLNLPAADGPFYKLLGWAGSHPLIGKEIEQDPVIRFARVLAAAEAGAAPTTTAETLAVMALSAAPSVRTEIAEHLGERADLRAKLTSLHWTQFVARATGETEDIPYKIALAELCAEQRLDGLLDTLAVSLGPVTDVRFARCVGRIGKLLYGEQATARLTDRLRMASQADDRRMLLLAIGATGTRSAADLLLDMDRSDDAVAAAMREHRSPRVKKALRQR